MAKLQVTSSRKRVFIGWVCSDRQLLCRPAYRDQQSFLWVHYASNPRGHPERSFEDCQGFNRHHSGPQSGEFLPSTHHSSPESATRGQENHGFPKPAKAFSVRLRQTVRCSSQRRRQVLLCPLAQGILSSNPDVFRPEQLPATSIYIRVGFVCVTSKFQKVMFLFSVKLKFNS